MSTEEVDYLNVKVLNAKEIAGEIQPVARTEEVEAEHFVAVSYTLPFGGPVTEPAAGNIEIPQPVLMLDPMRKTAILSINNPDPGLSVNVVLAHSQAVAQRLQQAPAGSGDEGAPILVAPNSSVNLTVKGTGPLWVVAQAAGSKTVNPAPGTPSTPQAATGAANATTTLTIPNPGLLSGRILTSLNWTFSAASLNATTLTITDGTTTFTQSIASGALAGSFTIPASGILFALNSPVTITLSAGGAAITSTLMATFQTQSQLVQEQAVTVGVVTERRGKDV